ncbi:hypothetical protein [Pontibacterium sp.]|uniref:hypothetical protein n=1 Tax=Pontibacterium sp. TaxID=2036026 RepID=UPI00356AA5A3
MKLQRTIPILFSCLLFGCNAANVQPEETPSAETPVVARPAAETDNKNDVASAVEQMTNRLTAVQEQVLNVRSQSARQLEQLQSLQVQLHALSQDMKRGRNSPGHADQGGEPSADEFALLLDQMAQTANEISLQMQDGSYRFVSCYTVSGQWILIRYDRYSGESWLADGGVWMALDDGVDVAGSIYEVSVERADKDAKGFVAARLDRQSGSVWWLKQNKWQLLEQ